MATMTELVGAAEGAVLHAQVEAGFLWFDTRQEQRPAAF